jgi:hypothetical protein
LDFIENPGNKRTKATKEELAVAPLYFVDRKIILLYKISAVNRLCHCRNGKLKMAR